MEKKKKCLSLGKLLTWILILFPVIFSGFFCLILDIVYGPVSYMEGSIEKTYFRLDLFQTLILSALPVYSFPLGGIVANGVVTRVKKPTTPAQPSNPEPA